MSDISDKPFCKGQNLSVAVDKNQGENQSVVGNDSAEPVNIVLEGEKTQSVVSYKSDKPLNGEAASIVNVFTLLLSKVTSKSSKFEVTPKSSKSKSEIKTCTKTAVTMLESVLPTTDKEASSSRAVDDLPDIKVGSISSISSLQQALLYAL